MTPGKTSATVTADRFAARVRERGGVATVTPIDASADSFNVDVERDGVSVRCIFAGRFQWAYRTDVAPELTTTIRSMKQVLETLGLLPGNAGGQA